MFEINSLVFPALLTSVEFSNGPDRLEGVFFAAEILSIGIEVGGRCCHFSN
jgi:hypothetical protein